VKSARDRKLKIWEPSGRGRVYPELTHGSARPARTEPAPPLRATGPRWYVQNMSRETSPSEPPSAAQLLALAPALYNFARYLCRDSAQAEDLVQEAFTRALGAQSTFATGSNLRAWLFRILRNAFLDAKRRERKGPLLRNAADDEPAAGDVWLRGDVEIDRLRGLVARDIDAALGRLSEDGRSVILLDLEGFTETEIASVMDSAVGTVKSRLARARAVLREALQEYAK